MRKQHRLLYLFLPILTFAFLLCAGCRQAQEEPIVYDAAYLGLDRQQQQLYSLSAAGDRLYMLCSAQSSSDGVVKVLDHNGTELDMRTCSLALLPATADGWSGGNAAEALAVDSSENLWLLGRHYSYCMEPEGLDPGISNTQMALSLTKIDMDGNILAAADLGALFPALVEGFQTPQLFCAGEYLCLLTNEQLCIFDSNAALISAIDRDFSAVTATGAGEIVAVKSGAAAAASSLCTVDPETGALRETLRLEQSFSLAYPGAGDTVYLNDTKKLYQCQPSSGTLTEVFTWSETDLSSGYIQQLTALNDGKFALLGEGLYNIGQDLIFLTPVPASQLPKRVTLKLAALSPSRDLRLAAVQFNQANPDYKIKIVEYQDYGSSTAMTHSLMTEIVTGDIPDLIDFTHMASTPFIQAGLMTDLYPYLAQDETLAAEGFLPNLLTAVETDGALYSLPRYFSAMVLAAPADLLPQREVWTIERLFDFLEDNPQYEYPFGTQYGRSIFLQAVLQLNWSSYLDLDAAVCTFDSDEFCRLLELAKRYLAPDEEAGGYPLSNRACLDIYNGRQLLYAGPLDMNGNLQIIEAAYGTEVSYIGFPTASGGQNVFQTEDSLGITEASPYKDVAWKFLRQLYLDASYEYFPAGGFPSNLTAYARYLDQMSTQKLGLDGNGQEVEYPKYYFSFGSGADRLDLELYAATPEERARLEALISEIDAISLPDFAVTDIVLSEVPAFFAGDKTAEETAAIIQDRVSLYLAEQYG